MNAELLVDALKSLEGIEIQLFLVDDQSVQGTLLSVQEDHIIVKVKENILYFPITQIKAISKNAKDFTFEKDGQNIAINRVKLEEILKTMYLQWITVNSLDEQSFSGVLSQVSEDYILLINGDRQYFILKSQITNVFNEQVDENQIVHLNSTETANNTLNNSTLIGEELTKEQKNAIAESIKEKVQNFVSEASDGVDHQESSVSPVAENEAAQQEEKIEQMTASPEEPSSDTHANPSEKLKKQTTAPKKKMKNQKRPLFQEIKFNSPIQECTWNEMDIGNLKKQTKQEEGLKKSESDVAQNIAEIAANEESAQNLLDEEKQKEETFEIQPAVGEIVAVERENAQELAEESNQTSSEAFEIQPVAGEIVAAKEEAKDETLEEENIEFFHESVPMLIEDNKRLLEYQYYALMKFAERMYHIENQYRALMKHAEKMYLQLKERRYY
ncbi:hypothetical protein ACFPN4_13460 [Ureibacillus thermophilus]|uniref:hypothetical protein n=1 Tax=Ureibacillus thermophilus TaxID=367743 RepID=UPI00360D51EA